MLKVGDFSKLAHVTVKTLRHYDELGLLRPVWTDRFSGYRYYALDQLPRLNRILALKDMGFSLAQVRQLLDSSLSPDDLRHLFIQKQRELAEQVRAEQERLARVDLRIRQIEEEGSLPLQDVTLKTVPAMWAASLRTSVRSSGDLPGRISRMRAELDEWARTNGLRDSGPWLTLYHHPEFHRQNLDIEIALCLAVDQPPRIRRGMVAAQLQQLPAVETMACLLQPAGSDPLEKAYTALVTWTDQQQYVLHSPLREVLLEDPTQQDGAARFVEVQIPVESYHSLKQKIMFSLNRKENEMEPKFVELTGLTVVGIPYVGLPGTQGIPQTWDIFNQRCTEIKHVSAGSPAYGVCYMLPDAGPNELEYTCSFAVDQVSDIPAEMVVRQIPAGRYAVFAHLGPLDNLKATYDYIYQVWLPQSGLQLTGGLDFELYNEEFVFGAADSKFYIYIPVK